MLDTLAYNEAPSISRQFRGKSSAVNRNLDRHDCDRNFLTICAMQGRNVVVSSHVARKNRRYYVILDAFSHKRETKSSGESPFIVSNETPIILSRRERRCCIFCEKYSASSSEDLVVDTRNVLQKTAELIIINGTLFLEFFMLNLSEIN
ncbi:hypothetical protein P5V15_008660 [Pogonomyrmex californicus]